MLTLRSNYPRIPSLLRIIFIIVAVVLLAGLSLFFAPSLIGGRWPWALKPFTARFLGAIYLAEMISIALTLLSGSWAVAKVTLPQAVTFTAFVLLASLIRVNDFNFGRPIVWIWFIIYIVPMLMLLWLWWQNRDRVQAGSPPVAWWRTVLQIEAGILCLYGLLLLTVPVWATGFWPWAIDAFHGQIYSALFFTGALGAWLLSQRATPQALLTFGASQAVLGIASIIGLILADQTTNAVNWQATTTISWILCFAVLAIIGIGVARYSLRHRD